MPPIEADLILLPQKPKIGVAVDPVAHALNSFLMIAKAEEFTGLGEWIARTAASLRPEQLHLNQLVCVGMHHALVPERRWPHFLAYLDDLAAQPAALLRDRLLRGSHRSMGERSQPPDAALVLESAEAYLAFLRQHFSAEAIDVAIETETYTLLLDPPKMQELIVSHLRAMWQLLAPEWERVKPLLQESAGAFQQLDFAGFSLIEAARLITGQDLTGKWESISGSVQQITFVPSAHIGPYLSKLMGEQIIWIIFGARLPDGAQARSSALGRSELLTRLSALTDDTRLLILELLSRHEELCAQDIMGRLELSQSAASRHLRLLSATGYLTERRRAGEKCYSLNRERVNDLFHALNDFLAQP
jgi:DNA-binding transcriptional ArsR family regulator